MQGLGFRVQGAGCRVQGSRVRGLGLWGANVFDLARLSFDGYCCAGGPEGAEDPLRLELPLLGEQAVQLV